MFFMHPFTFELDFLLALKLYFRGHGRFITQLFKSEIGAVEDIERAGKITNLVLTGKIGHFDVARAISEPDHRIADLFKWGHGPAPRHSQGVNSATDRHDGWASLNFYNVLNQTYYYPDPFYDLAPTLEVSPTPAPGWSTFFQIGGKPF